MPERIAVVTTLIVERPMCLECVADRAGLATSEIETILQQIARGLELHYEAARCRICGATKRVVSIDPPPELRRRVGRGG